MTLLVDKISDMAIDYGVGWLRSQISGTIAESRLRGFVHALLNEATIEPWKTPSEEEVNSRLTAILKSEKSKEILFEAYKRVCLSSSKEIGPRIIGLLTGQLLAADRFADEIEEIIFRAAEDLNDVDLRWVAKTVKTALEKPNLTLEIFPAQPGEFLLYRFEGNYPPNVVQKLIGLGIARLKDNAPNTVNSTKIVIARKEFERFANLIDRATGPAG